jgi:hypothetical protein
MAWTETTRPQHDRHGVRYASDCTKEEWAVVAPFLEKRRKVDRPLKQSLHTLWEEVCST